MTISKDTTVVNIKEDKISFSGGAPRFSFKRSLSGKMYAIKASRDALRISTSFMLQKSDETTLDTLFSWYKEGAMVDLSVDNKSWGVVITQLSWDDDGEILRGRIEFVEVDEVVDNG